MKKIFLGLSVLCTTLMSAQVYQDYYPTSGSNSQYNMGYYDRYNDEFYFPDEYYYEYPTDYYSNDLYRSYYNDYRRSIQQVNWSRFFSMYQLAPWQMQQIILLNEQFPSFSAWNSYYRYNPDRWYYDRFYALERILGPRVFVIFQNSYYNGYNPVVYYQNYRVQHYSPRIYVVPRYRDINVNRYRVDRVKYHQANPRNNFGFRDAPRINNGNNGSLPRGNGFRDDAKPNSNTSSGFRNGNEEKVRNIPENRGFRNQAVPQNGSNSGFRNEAAPRKDVPQRSIENAPGTQNNPSPGLRTPNSNRTSGLRLTAR